MAETPLVVVPANEQMATEPARAIAAETAPQTIQQYSTVDRVKLLATAVIGLLAVVGVRVAPDLNQSVQDVITYGTPLAMMLYAWWQTERTKRNAVEAQANRQAEETRAAVYAPATVAAIVAGDAPAGEKVDAVIVPPPTGDGLDTARNGT